MRHLTGADVTSRRRAALTGLLALVLCLATGPTAAQGKKDWPQYRGGPERNNYRKVKDKIRVPRVLWKIDYAPMPAAVGEDVYAGGAELRRVDLRQGAIKASWKPKQAGKKFAFLGTPVVLEDRVIAHDSDGYVRALDRGLTRVLWSTRIRTLESYPFSGACDGGVYVLAAGNQVVAVEVSDGKTRWKFRPEGRARIQLSPAIADGKALFGATNGCFYAVDVKNGQELWRYDGERPFAWTDPVVAFGKVFVGDRGGFINALDLEKGTRVWSLESGAKGLSTPGVFPGNILVGFSRFVATINAKKGEFDQSKQGFRTDFNPFGHPTLVGRTLFFGNLDGHLYAFDYKRERFKWAFEVGDEAQVLSLVYHRDILLVSTTEGLFALGNDPKKRRLPANFVLKPKPEKVVPRGPGFYVNDVEFAVKKIGRLCRRFFKPKKIDWRKVSKEFLTAAKQVKNDSDHLVLLVRLLARLKDGHAAVLPLEKGRKVKWPEEDQREEAGPGMFWCRVGKKIIVKNSWSAAEGSGIKPGMEVLAVDGRPVEAWLKARIEELSDLKSFSTAQQAFFFACHWGLAAPKGSRMKLEVKDRKGKKKKVTLTIRNASMVPSGPAFYPEGVQRLGRDSCYGKTAGGYGYIHLRRCPGNLPEQVDEALAALGNVPGLILDFRANGGGGFDHEGFMGRFIPKGKRLAFNKPYRSAGPNPYGGPIVVIVDAGTRSAGETASVIFKEDGRGYLIGETPTAGMSSQKKVIDLPSGLFALKVSIFSNLGRANNGRGLEGIGAIPHEIVEYDPKDLENGVDTLIRRAEELLKDYPKKKVPYDPAKFGWKG
jgi:outer membrane protein assembly factor BamB/C-terminal processing protease CtpA/Prc